MLTIKALAPLGLATLTLLPLQERVKPRTAASFDDTLAAVAQAWKEERYSTALNHIKTLQSHCHVKRVEAIHAALPPAPEGWQKVENTARKDAASQAAAGITAGFGLGNMSEHKYQETDGRGRVNITIMADSPMIGMFRMLATNPAALQENQELIKYGKDMAVLETQRDGKRYKLTIIVGDKHSVDVQLDNGTDDFLLKLMDQATVDRLGEVLSK